MTSRGSYTVITKYLIITTPIWVYVVSIMGGLLVLILLTYGLYKMGFFRREKKEELQKLARQVWIEYEIFQKIMKNLKFSLHFQSQLQNDDEETEDEL